VRSPPLPYGRGLRSQEGKMNLLLSNKKVVKGKNVFLLERCKLGKRTEKTIEFYTEVLKLLVLLLVATAGGTVSLLYKMQFPISVPLIFFGAWISFSLVLGIVWTTLKIRKKLEELDE